MKTTFLTSILCFTLLQAVPQIDGFPLDLSKLSAFGVLSFVAWDYRKRAEKLQNKLDEITQELLKSKNNTPIQA